MAKRQFELSEGEVGQLRQREQQTGNVAELKRLQAVRLYGSGQGMAGNKDMNRCAGSNIRGMGQDYKPGGVAGVRGQFVERAPKAIQLRPTRQGAIPGRL